MNIQMPRRKREFAGVASALLGVILITYAGVRLGRKVEFWGGHYADKFESIPKSFTEKTKKADYEIKYSIEEIGEEIKYLEKTGYIGVGGVMLLFGGAVIVGTKKNLPWISKPTDYDESLLTYKRGTREHPYRL